MSVAITYFHANSCLSRLQPHIRGLLNCIWMLILTGLPAKGLASPDSVFPDIAKRFSAVNVDWGDDNPMIMGGVATRTLAFVSSHRSADVARAFSDASSVFDRVLTQPGQLVLSGMNDNWHWIAVLQDDSRGTKGYVSAMHTVPAVSAEPPFWLPVNAISMSSFSDSIGGKLVTQHAHQIPWSFDTWRVHITEFFARRGWKLLNDVGSMKGQWHWHRRGQRILMMAMPHSGGTLVVTQQSAGVLP